jgi:hypothetical protein
MKGGWNDQNHNDNTTRMTKYKFIQLRVRVRSTLRRIFGSKRDDVTGEWRTLHSEELHKLYSSTDTIRQIKTRRMRWAGGVVQVVYKVYKFLVGKPEGKRPLVSRSR